MLLISLFLFIFTLCTSTNEHCLVFSRDESADSYSFQRTPVNFHLAAFSEDGVVLTNGQDKSKLHFRLSNMLDPLYGVSFTFEGILTISDPELYLASENGRTIPRGEFSFFTFLIFF